MTSATEMWAKKSAAQTAELLRLRAFARWVVQEGPFEGGGLDGGDIQDQAVKLGIIQPTKYDPEKHGPNSYGVEPGQDWFVFTFDAAVT